MATIVKTGNIMEVAQLNQTPTTRIVDWQRAIFNVQETPEDDFIINIQFNPTQNFTFGSWKYTTQGELTAIGGASIETDTKAQILTKLQTLFTTA
jgi:hypothetical protein